MVKLYGQSGQLARALWNYDEEVQYGAPAGYDFFVEFDAATNATLCSRINQDWNGFTTAGGLLQYRGEPVIISPPSAETVERDTMQGWTNVLNTAIATTGTVRTQAEQQSAAWDALTTQQKQTWLLNNFGTVLSGIAYLARVVHEILRFIRWRFSA